MKEKVLNTCDGKQYTFSTYFIINNGKLFSTDNFNFEDNLKNCFYVKKYGSNLHPKIYLDTKVDNKWINKNQLIGDYYSFMDFIAQNKSAFICIRGFGRAQIGHFIRMVNELKGTNIKPAKFKNKIAEAQYGRHIATNEQQNEELNEKLGNSKDIETDKEYVKNSNLAFCENKHKIRRKIIQLKRK